MRTNSCPPGRIRPVNNWAEERSISLDNKLLLASAGYISDAAAVTAGPPYPDDGGSPVSVLPPHSVGGDPLTQVGVRPKSRFLRLNASPLGSIELATPPSPGFSSKDIARLAPLSSFSACSPAAAGEQASNQAEPQWAGRGVAQKPLIDPIGSCRKLRDLEFLRVESDPGCDNSLSGTSESGGEVPEVHGLPSESKRESSAGSAGSSRKAGGRAYGRSASSSRLLDRAGGGGAAAAAEVLLPDCQLVTRDASGQRIFPRVARGRRRSLAGSAPDGQSFSAAGGGGGGGDNEDGGSGEERPHLDAGRRSWSSRLERTMEPLCDETGGEGVTCGGAGAPSQQQPFSWKQAPMVEENSAVMHEGQNSRTASKPVTASSPWASEGSNRQWNSEGGVEEVCYETHPVKVTASPRRSMRVSLSSKEKGGAALSLCQGRGGTFRGPPQGSELRRAELQRLLSLKDLPSIGCSLERPLGATHGNGMICSEDEEEPAGDGEVPSVAGEAEGLSSEHVPSGGAPVKAKATDWSLGDGLCAQGGRPEGGDFCLDAPSTAHAPVTPGGLPGAGPKWLCLEDSGPSGGGNSLELRAPSEASKGSPTQQSQGTHPPGVAGKGRATAAMGAGAHLGAGAMDMRSLEDVWNSISRTVVASTAKVALGPIPISIAAAASASWQDGTGRRRR